MPLILPDNPFCVAPEAELKAHQEAARAHCSANLAGTTVRNASSGHLITVTMGGIKHSLHGAMHRRVWALYLLPEILTHAEHTGTVPDKKGAYGTLAVHKFSMEIHHGSDLLVASVVVKEFRGGQNNFYDLAFLKD